MRTTGVGVAVGAAVGGASVGVVPPFVVVWSVAVAAAAPLPDASVETAVVPATCVSAPGTEVVAAPDLPGYEMAAAAPNPTTANAATIGLPRLMRASRSTRRSRTVAGDCRWII